ncbi:MAG: hypothetical protein ACUVTM_08255 [Candidatus Bathyarchaeia archaeon]
METGGISVEMKIDGREVRMNRFVQQIVSNIIIGILNSLHDVDDWHEATLTVKKI